MSDFDLNGGLSLDDLSEFISEADAEIEVVEDEEPDLFTGKFMLDFFGLIPNTILKEDEDVLRMLVYISINAPTKRAELKALIREMDIMLKHVEKKIFAKDVPTDIDSVLMNDMYKNFHDKVQAMKTAFNDINFDLNIEDSMLNYSENSDSNIGNIDLLSRPDAVKTIVAYIIGTNKYDSIPGKSIAISMSERYRAFSKSYSYVKEIADNFRRIDHKNTENEMEKTSIASTLDKLITYKGRTYEYTEEELKVMKYLGFPYKSARYEHYFKDSPFDILNKLVDTFISPAKSKIEEAYKASNKNKEGRILEYSTMFDRKAYMCKLNAKIGVNSSCMYF